MSGKLMGELYNVELSKPLRDVALALANFADDDGYGIFPSVGRVAWMLGQDRRYLQRRIRKLQELGVLVEVQPATARQAAEYRMELAGLDRKPAYEPPHRHRSRCGVETAPDEAEVRSGGSTGAVWRPPYPSSNHQNVSSTGTVRGYREQEDQLIELELDRWADRLAVAA